MTGTLKEKENKMINDLISRQEAIKAIHEEYDEVLNIDEPGKWIANDVEEILRGLPPTEKLENAPPAERKKGYWIVNAEEEDTISGWCSACGWQSHLYEDDVVGMNFCPNCGVKMEVNE